MNDKDFNELAHDIDNTTIDRYNQYHEETLILDKIFGKFTFLFDQILTKEDIDNMFNAEIDKDFDNYYIYCWQHPDYDIETYEYLKNINYGNNDDNN